MIRKSPSALQLLRTPRRAPPLFSRAQPSRNLASPVFPPPSPHPTPYSASPFLRPNARSYHTNVAKVNWGIASPVEYDVPKCEEGVKGCSKEPKTGRWVHTINGTYYGKGSIAAAHFHCHAPTCKSMKMYRNDTGELICAEYPVYGGTGKIDNKHMDEPGFILQPPCLWGDAQFGLEAPPNVDGILLHTVKEAYADSGHHGEMAWQQMYTF